MDEILSKDWEEWIQLNLGNGSDKKQMIDKLLEGGYSSKLVSKRVYGDGLLELNNQWNNWLNENIEKGVKSVELYNILLREGYNCDMISKKLNHYPDELSIRIDGDINYRDSYKALKDIHLVNSYKLDSPLLDLYIVDDFLDKDSCKGLCKLIKKRNRRSTITNDNEPDKYYRTSKTCDFELTNDLVNSVDKQICDYLGVPTERSETMQGQYYEIGNQFKKHTDWFDPNNEKEWSQYGSDMGQRTWTFMIYLNDVEEGGETYFPKLDFSVKPKKGRAVVWYNMYPNGKGNPDTLHWGTSIKKGEKYIITKWFRTRGTLNEPYKLLLPKIIPNYTRLGYKRYRLSDSLYSKILDFYRNNKKKIRKETDHAVGSYVLTKSKIYPSLFLDIPSNIESDIKNELIKPLEKWSGTRLEWTAMYGIRIYQRDSFLKMHVDRYKTHIISIILNVGQDVEEDWPLVLIDNYGRTNKIILSPGEVLFYESSRCYHGRPYKLKGNYFANIFAHTRPKDWETISKKYDKLNESNSIILE